MTNEPAALILGAGHWHASWHAESLVSAGIEIRGVWDPEPEKAERFVRRWGGHLADNWEQMLGAYPECVVVVLVPHDKAPEILRTVVEREMRFVVEKPGTVDASHLAPIVDEAKAKGLPNRALLVNRRNAFWAALRDDLDLRDWKHAHFSMLAGGPARYREDGVGWVLDPLRSGGGALRNLGIHATDAVVALMGSEVKVVSAVAQNSLYGEQVDDYSNAIITDAQGRTAQIEIAYAMPEHAPSSKQWRVHGSDWAVIEGGGQLLVATSDGTSTSPAIPASKHYLAAAADAVIAVHLGLALEPYEADIDDLYRAQLLVDQIYAAAGLYPPTTSAQGDPTLHPSPALCRAR